MIHNVGKWVYPFPYGLMVRISVFHTDDPSSILGVGAYLFLPTTRFFGARLYLFIVFITTG